MSTGANGQAAFWLEVGSRVVMHSEYSSASGGGGTGAGGWQRCATSGCLGSVVGASDRCFVHAADSERASHLQEVSLGLRSLDLRGTEMPSLIVIHAPPQQKTIIETRHRNLRWLGLMSLP
jgi:hypothetical protein